MNSAFSAVSTSGEFARTLPFPHAVLLDVLPPGLAATAFRWLEQEAAWRLERSTFYSQFGCRNTNALGRLIPRELWDALAAHLSKLFGARLSVARATLSVHRLLPGQGIGIHNDDPSRGTETHRLVVTFTRSYEDCHGGHLLLFHQRDHAAVAQIFRPLFGVGVAFPLSSCSWHAVTDVASGTRYSLIFSFWEEGALCEVTGTIHGVQPRDDALPISKDGALATDFRSVVRLLDRLGAGTVPHSGATLLTHLISTGLLLKSWGCSETVCAAGLTHSVYGTASFSQALLAHDERHILAESIGSEAERLAFRFAMGEEAGDADLGLIRKANRLEQERPR